MTKQRFQQFTAPAAALGQRQELTATVAVAMAVLLSLALATGAGAYSQPMRFDRLSLDEGLSQSTVLTILQDRDGFIWFGTESGLNRYDGRGFSVYGRGSDPNDLVDDFVWDLESDEAGSLWIGTAGGGVARLERATGRFAVYRHRAGDEASLSSDLVRTIALDRAGAVWIGTRDGGLNRLDPATGFVTRFRHNPADPTSLSSDEIYAILGDRSGALWVGTDRGLNRLDPASRTFTRFRHDPGDPRSLSHDFILSLFEDRSGALWVGTYGGGLNRLDRDSGTFTRFQHDPADPASLSDDRVRTILESEARRLWVGTVNGLNLLDRETGTFTRYVHDPANPNSLSHNEVMSLAQDRSGIVWIGTRSGGVNKWNPRTWAFGHHVASPDRADGLSSSHVTSFSEDSLGRLWIGTLGGGLNLVDRIEHRVTHYRAASSGLSDDRVMSLLHDHNGTAWIGTMTGGLNRLDPATGSFRVYRHDPKDPSSLSADGVMALFEDRRGAIWVGTFGGGVSRFDRDSDSFVRFAHDPNDARSLSSPRATAFAEDLTGGLWVGTDGGGLNLLDRSSGTFHQFRHHPDDPRSLGSDTVFALHVDPEGTLWVGTRGAGLARLVGSALDPGTISFEHFSKENGLPDDVVYGILSDTSGDLWLSTNNGLARFDPGTGKTKSFSVSHGLQAREFNFGAHFRSTGGELYFGGPNGFNHFLPANLRPNNHTPPVVLTSFLKLNRPVSTDRPHTTLERIHLGYQDDVVSFEFAALDFAAPAENRYAVMLEGFDFDWVDMGHHNRVTYTDLDAGDYTLRVRAANNDGVWNADGLALAISVAPAPWQTWWAYSGYSLAVFFALAGAWRTQQRKLRREAEYSQRLEEEVGDRTRELADRNAELESLNNRLLEASLTDPLTGLRNRRFLFEQVAKDIDMVRRRYYEIASGISSTDNFDLVFMMVDLDHFKSVNDSLGHEAGDRILLQVRNVLLRACRSSDIVIRWGGDEFLVIGRDSDPERAQILAERIRTSIEEKVFALDDGQVVRTTCSVGFACYPFVHSQPDFLSWEQILNLADSALYTAKESRNRWVGFLSTPQSLTTDGLFRTIREDPETLIEEGALELRSSNDPRAEAEVSSHATA